MSTGKSKVWGSQLQRGVSTGYKPSGTGTAGMDCRPLSFLQVLSDLKLGKE